MAARSPLPVLGAVALAAWLAYTPMLGAYFRNDDFGWLHVAQEWVAGRLPLTQGDAGVTPLYNVLLYALYRSAGLNARPYFLASLLAHVLVSLLVGLLLWRLTRSRAATLAGGLCFALLFSHQEAVAWPIQLNHVLGAMFGLGALHLWLGYREGHPAGWPLALLAAQLALLCKDSAVALLPVAVALDWLVYPRAPRWPLLGWALPAAGFGLWRMVFTPHHESIGWGSADFHLGPHVLTNLALVPPQMVLPDLRFENYAALLQRFLPEGLVQPLLVLTVPVLGAATALALYGWWRGSARTRLGVLWCYLGFLPFLPFSYHYARAPRYGYFASVGLALLTGLLAQWAWRARHRSRVRSGLVLGALALYLLGAVGLLRVTAQNRLRDSEIRRTVLAIVTHRLGAPPPGQVVYLRGLPERFWDLQVALPLFYAVPIHCRVSDLAAPPGAVVFDFAAGPPVRLKHWERRPAGGAPAG